MIQNIDNKQDISKHLLDKLRVGAVSGSALSPVEWLEKEVKKRFGGETFTSVFSAEFEKAKQMEKDLSVVS